ncbi:MAG: YigZ family protein [Chlorobi bacterium]|nr:YigZ family protein [Chlorobiota bacterium]
MALLSDEYLTIDKPSEGIYKEKGSKFLAFAFPVKSEEEIKNHQKNLRKKYYDARHHCYAFRLGADLQFYRSSDDGEPSNSSGPPILGQIQSKNLTNILIVVVRYFGGTKLGIPGLINAYKSAAIDAIGNAKIIKKTENDWIEVKFSYDSMNSVMKIIKEEKLQPINQKFDLNCSLNLSIRKYHSERIIKQLSKIENVIINL